MGGLPGMQQLTGPWLVLNPVSCDPAAPLLAWVSSRAQLHVVVQRGAAWKGCTPESIPVSVRQRRLVTCCQIIKASRAVMQAVRLGAHGELLRGIRRHLLQYVCASTQHMPQHSRSTQAVRRGF